MQNRVDKRNYYLDIAETVASRSTCLRKCCGAVIVNGDEVISTGYNGSPRGTKNCLDLGFCTKKKTFPDVRHAGYSACRSVHAEQNAIISSSRKQMVNGDLYLACYKILEDGSKAYVEDIAPCLLCRNFIINSGISTVYARINKTDYKKFDVEDFIKDEPLLNGILAY